MCRASGCTGYTGPANPYAIRLANTTCPIFFGSVLAPITATDPGVSMRSIEWASARRSRSNSTARDFSVGAMGNVSCTTPESYWYCAE